MTKQELTLKIHWSCQCGARLQAPVASAGKPGKCPQCNAAIVVPQPPAAAWDVFISYSSKDKPTADAACAVLEAQGLRCWIAPRDILPGMEWGEAIVNGIAQCQMFLLIFSANANDSAQVRREVERAISKEKPILPFRVQEITPSKALEYCLGNTHWLDAFTPPLGQHLLKLADTARQLLGRSGQPSPKPAFTSTAPMRLADAGQSPARADLGTPVKNPTAPVRTDNDDRNAAPSGYKYIDTLARTASSLIVRVLDERTGKPAVLKRSSRSMTGIDLSGSGIESSRILVPLKHWSDGESQYELLNWVEGYTLEAIIRFSNTPVRGALLDYWVTMLVELLESLHGANPPIIHRDVTPSNILVSPADLSLSIIDTTSACRLGAPQTPVGSLSYAPGEQLRGNAVPASDLYSIGAVAHHLAMCRLPPNFQRREQSERSAQGNLLRIDTGGLGGLETWLLSFLCLDWSERPRDASAAIMQKPHEHTLPGSDLGRLPLPNGAFVAMGDLTWELQS